MHIVNQTIIYLSHVHIYHKHTISPKNLINVYTHLLNVNHSMDNLYHLLELHQYFEILKYDIYLIKNMPTISVCAQYTIGICSVYNQDMLCIFIIYAYFFLLDSLALLDLRVNNFHHIILNYLILFFSIKLDTQGYNISKKLA